MGLFNIISKQFIDVLQWNEDGAGVLAWRFPMQDQEIQNGASLTVRESQRAVFINEGTVADVFGPGRYTLTTQSLPVMTALKNWDKLFESPFKSDVYFFSLREQTDQKWGTATPITVRDKEFGVVRLRANGIYSYQLKDIQTFWTKLSGTTAQYTVADIEGQLRATILTSLAAFFGGSNIPFLDMAGNQLKFSELLKAAVTPAFADFGLELKSFFVQSIALPEELQAHLDKVSSMQMIGDLKRYTQFQAADSISIAAANTGGVAGAGAGLGAGMALGQMMTGALNQSTATAPTTGGNDPFVALEKLAELLKRGIITQADFDAKKTELLQQIK
jgi:membrane protease subunit (stomatin/prohibitin family)